MSLKKARKILNFSPFSIGVAYILTLLNQCFFFNSLNWHDSAQSHFRAEMEKCAEEQKVAQKRKDESLGRVLAVKMVRDQKQKKFRKPLKFSNFQNPFSPNFRVN